MSDIPWEKNVQTCLAFRCPNCSADIFRSKQTGYSKGEKIDESNTACIQGHEPGDFLMCRKCESFQFTKEHLTNLMYWDRIYRD